MLRLVESILKKHLDNVPTEWAIQDEVNYISSWDVLYRGGEITYEERKALARELIVAIRGIDLSDLRRIPSFEEAKKFIVSLAPFVDWEERHQERCAKRLVEWLGNYRLEGK